MENSKSLLEYNCQEEKKANALLRERFLYLISTLSGNKLCKIKMYENSEVTGYIKAIDLNFQNIIVENLKTPLPNPMKVAILRTSDILSISLEQTELD